MWEEIDEDTARLKVPNGWIVKCFHWRTGIVVIFVEDSEHTWEFKKEKG